MINENCIDYKYRGMAFIIMLYITLMLAANVVIYKLITIGGITLSAGIFIIPLVHVLLDVISERYGFFFAKKIIWIGLVCQFIFALVCMSVILLPSPSYWHNQHSYDQVLGKLFRVFIGSFLGTFIGLFINAKILSKWKILVKGKYFWLRCIGASAIGQLLFSIITIMYDMYGIQPINIILKIIIPSYLIKLGFTCIAATPAAYLVAFLKVYEKTENHEPILNPFKSEFNMELKC